MLTTVDSIVEAIGGTSATASLARVKPPAVSNWKARGRIPSGQYLNFSEALKRRGQEADPALFGLNVAEANA